MALLESAKKLLPEDLAPEFSLKNVDESLVSPEQFKGKILVIIFMCNHCPYVHPKMEEIAEIQNEYSKEVVVLCINSNDATDYLEDDFEHMQKIAAEYGYKYYLLDESQDIARVYGATCTPDPFIFDKEHKLVYHGRINDALDIGDKISEHTMKNILDKLIAGETIEEWFLPSRGCSIKWR